MHVRTWKKHLPVRPGSPCVPMEFLVAILVALLLVSPFSFVDARGNLPRSSQHAIPRSSNSQLRRNLDYPPWNPSSKIDPSGFLTELFQRKNGDWEEEVRLRTSFSTELPCQIRQVPGDGNCLFHSLSLCMQYAMNQTHWDLTTHLDELYQHSRQLRSKAVACLRQKHRRLFLQGRESLRAHDLVTAAAQQYGMTPEEYCASMEEDCVWGGGPEIVAISNILCRPIHVYELAVEEAEKTKKPTFVLRRMACFGSPKFDRRQPLHILSADSRFPDLYPGNQMTAGNHFLALFPQTRKRRRRLRGGDFCASGKELEENSKDCDEQDLPLAKLSRFLKNIFLGPLC